MGTNADKLYPTTLGEDWVRETQEWVLRNPNTEDGDRHDPLSNGFQRLPFTGSISVINGDQPYWAVSILRWRRTEVREFSNGDFEMPDPTFGFLPLSEWKDVEFATAFYWARTLMNGLREQWLEGVEIVLSGPMVLFKLPLNEEEIARMKTVDINEFR